MVGLVSACRACGGRLAVTMADLGMQPASNAFIESQAAFEHEKRYPLRAKVCETCKLVQVDYDVAPQELFGNYVYFSSYSDDWLAHAKAYCDMARQRFALARSSLVVELASNDGYLLKNFLTMGIPVLGQKLARDLVRQGRQADLIIGNNVLAHVPQLNDFVAGMALLLRPNGNVTIEFPHLLELIEHVEFDTIYHEHFSYFSVYAIEQVFARHGLRLYDVERLPTHGGSLRIFAAHAARSDLKDSTSLSEVRAQESAAGLADLATYLKFSKRVEECRDSLLAFLAAAKREGKRVVAYGAAAKGNTLLNFCSVTPQDIAFVADRNPHKQKKFLPGTHIPVVSPEELMQAKPDYVLILPWNLRDEIRQQLKRIEAWGGRFVTPVPVARIS
jgi:C-methyltransferase C-terminal domain/Putative zinc binding domain/Methyltransferase domain